MSIGGSGPLPPLASALHRTILRRHQPDSQVWGSMLGLGVGKVRRDVGRGMGGVKVRRVKLRKVLR